MRRATAALAVVALAGCASACKGLPPLAVSIQPTVVETRVVVAPAVPHALLLNLYADAVQREHAIVPKAKAPTIYRIIALDAAARKALAPLKRRHHIATVAESAKAVTAVGSLEGYVTAPTP